MSIEFSGVDGKLPKGRIAIIASRYNEAICDSLVEGAKRTLAEAGYDAASVVVVRVPGAWELPIVAARMLKQSKMIAVITLGCVIKGETTHDEHINRAVSEALMRLSIESDSPVGFGLLTCNTVEQALQRSGGNVGNKGEEAAEAVLELLRLAEKM
tara:strand:- start:12096 stop:12563 length:468 start_codon:yes stop_codon:yes gene_type:complete